MRAHFQNQFAIAGKPRHRRLHARDKLDPPRGIAEGTGAVGGLLVKTGKADADHAAVGLAVALPDTNRGIFNELGRAPERGGVIPAVERLLVMER